MLTLHYFEGTGPSIIIFSSPATLLRHDFQGGTRFHKEMSGVGTARNNTLRSVAVSGLTVHGEKGRKSASWQLDRATSSYSQRPAAHRQSLAACCAKSVIQDQLAALPEDAQRWRVQRKERIAFQADKHPVNC